MFEDLSLEFYLYMGHKFRVMNQNTTMKDVMVILEDDSSVCVVGMDFNIKFYTMKHHDNVVKHFGKRGLSSHVDLVLYSVRVDFDTSVD